MTTEPLLQPDHEENGAAPDMKNIVILTSNILEAHTTTAEDFREALKMSPALKERFNKVIKFDPLSDDAIKQIAQKLLEKELNTTDLPAEGKNALGDLAMELAARGGYEPDKGIRSLRKALSAALAMPLTPEIEDALCAGSGSYAAGVSQRRAGELAEGFTVGVDATPMKPLRLCRKNGFAAVQEYSGAAIFAFKTGMRI